MATYAGRYDEVLLRKAGNRVAPPAANTTVQVYQSDGSAAASLYTDRTKATAADNPVSVDASGNLEFFAAPGTYVLSIRESGSEVATNTIVVLPDPAEPSTVEGPTDEQMLREWAMGGDFEMTTITYDGTYTSVISTATVKWPDESAGTFTTTDINETWDAIDAFTVSHTDSGLTVTQSTVTRNGSGMVTTKPALTIA
jgi:hypothetical protein